MTVALYDLTQKGRTVCFSFSLQFFRPPRTEAAAPVARRKHSSHSSSRNLQG
uniref:Uncharacterized protein n=1 Tax=Zea mays TaxID=4577 RepID=C4J786_MAIZE|nr:unknown [Zea mays]